MEEEGPRALTTEVLRTHRVVTWLWLKGLSEIKVKAEGSHVEPALPTRHSSASLESCLLMAMVATVKVHWLLFIGCLLCTCTSC